MDNVTISMDEYRVLISASIRLDAIKKICERRKMYNIPIEVNDFDYLLEGYELPFVTASSKEGKNEYI